MKVNDIILTEQDVMSDLRNEIINLLSMASARGINKFRIQYLIKNLQSYGIDADVQAVSEILNTLQIVSSVDDDIVNLNGFDVDADTMDYDQPEDMSDPSGEISSDGPADWEEDRVDSAAKRQATKGL